MLTKLTSKDIYKKTYSFFSEARQEKFINTVEQEFYSILRDLKNNKIPKEHQKIRFSKLQQKIDKGGKSFYFTPELEIYIESLSNLVASYIRKLSDTHIK